jgi:hypothetical protein
MGILMIIQWIYLILGVNRGADRLGNLCCQQIDDSA